MANDKIIHGGLVIKGSLATDDTLPILTIDTDGTIKKRAAIDLSTLLGGSLAQYNVLVGDSGGAAAAVDTNSVGDILVDETNGLNIKSGVIVNADINNSAAIAYSKLSLTGSIVNADVASGAAIVYSKLNLTGSIVNADIASGAAITRTKLATGTAYRILANNASGVISENAAITASRAVVSDPNGQLVAQADGTTAVQVGYLSDTTGPIQNQLDNLLATKPVNALVKSPTSGEDGFAITWDNGAGEWNLTDPVIQGIPVGGSSRQFLGKNSGTNYDASWLDLVLTDVTDVTAVYQDVNLLAGLNTFGLTTGHLQYVKGLTSNAQTQIDSKQSRTLAQNAIWVGNSSNLAAALAAGTEGYVLKITSGAPTWAAESAGSPPGSDTEVVFNDAGSFGTDADLTYNKTTNTLTLANLGTTTTIGSAYIYRVGGTDVAVADGGTGLSSISALSLWVANSANTITEVTPAAGQSVRINAGGTAWEAYTPSSGVSSGANNEVQTSDGSGGFVASNLFFDETTGNMTLGDSGLSGSQRIINVAGSASDLNFTLQAKGIGSVSFVTASGLIAAVSGINNAFYLDGSGAPVILTSVDYDAQDVDSTDLIIRTGDAGSGGTGNHSVGHLYLDLGTPQGTAPQSNIGLFTTSVADWQDMEKGLFVGNVTTEPTAAIANGFALYSKDSSDGASNATLGLYTEQAVEAIGTFTASHKLKIWINGVEYWIQLDAV